MSVEDGLTESDCGEGQRQQERGVGKERAAEQER